MGQNEKVQTLGAKVQFLESLANGKPTGSFSGQSNRRDAWAMVGGAIFVKGHGRPSHRGGRISRKPTRVSAEWIGRLQLAILVA